MPSACRRSGFILHNVLKNLGLPLTKGAAPKKAMVLMNTIFTNLKNAARGVACVALTTLALTGGDAKAQWGADYYYEMNSAWGAGAPSGFGACKAEVAPNTLNFMVLSWSGQVGESLLVNDFSTASANMTTLPSGTLTPKVWTAASDLGNNFAWVSAAAPTVINFTQNSGASWQQITLPSPLNGNANYSVVHGFKDGNQMVFGADGVLYVLYFAENPAAAAGAAGQNDRYLVRMLEVYPNGGTSVSNIDFADDPTTNCAQCRGYFATAGTKVIAMYRPGNRWKTQWSGFPFPTHYYGVPRYWVKDTATSQVGVGWLGDQVASGGTFFNQSKFWITTDNVNVYVLGRNGTLSATGTADWKVWELPLSGNGFAGNGPAAPADPITNLSILPGTNVGSYFAWNYLGGMTSADSVLGFAAPREPSGTTPFHAVDIMYRQPTASSGGADSTTLPRMRISNPGPSSSIAAGHMEDYPFSLWGPGAPSGSTMTVGTFSNFNNASALVSAPWVTIATFCQGAGISYPTPLGVGINTVDIY